MYSQISSYFSSCFWLNDLYYYLFIVYMRMPEEQLSVMFNESNRRHDGNASLAGAHLLYRWEKILSSFPEVSVVHNLTGIFNSPPFVSRLSIVFAVTVVYLFVFSPVHIDGCKRSINSSFCTSDLYSARKTPAYVQVRDKNKKIFHHSGSGAREKQQK